MGSEKPQKDICFTTCLQILDSLHEFVFRDDGFVPYFHPVIIDRLR